MSDTDPADIFQSHRSAVLNALLSEPAPHEMGAGHAGEPSTEEEVAVPARHDPGQMVGEQTLGPARRKREGPRASDQILALLNGREPESDAAVELSADLTALAARRLKARPAPDSESVGESVRAPGGRDRMLQASGRLDRLKRPRVILTTVAVLSVLLVLLLVTTGGKRQSGQLPMVTAMATTPAAPQTTPAAAMTGAPIQVKSADSHCPPGSTAGMDAFAGQGKAWSCIRAYKVDGQVLRIDLGKTYRIDSIGLVPGWDSIGTDGVDEWTRYRTASRVSYRFDDPNTTTYTQRTLDQRTLVVTKINPPVTASHILLTVLASNGNSLSNSVAISSIVITGQ